PLLQCVRRRGLAGCPLPWAGHMPLFDADDDRLAVVLDRRGSNHASITAHNDIEEFAIRVPVIVGDAAACNAFPRYTGGLGYLRDLSTSFETVSTALDAGRLSDHWTE